MKMNSLFLADGYKVGHYNMYQDGTEVVYSNFTPRSNKYAPRGNNGKVLNFGQQYAIRFIVEHFNENFFNLKKEDVILDIKKNFSDYLGVEYDTTHIEQLHDLGYLPLEIRSLDEGTESSIKVPIVFLYNTDIRFAWVTNYIETILSNLLWQPVTTATNVLLMKRIVKEAVLKTDKENIGLIDFMLHDFSMRGLTGLDATIGSGLAFASVSKGSDSLPVIKASQHYYGETSTPIFSVRASEHSQMTSCGVDGEFDVYKNLINKFPTGIMSLVSDSYDLWRVLTDFLPRLKEDILARDGKIVIRPDCYSEDTLFLTNYGWKNIDAIEQGALVAQVEDDGSYTFVRPSKIVNESYEGEMYKYTDFHGKMDLLVTPNHRMVYKQFDNWKVDYAESCKPNNYTKQFIRSAKAVNKNRKLSFIERLNIAFQADGSYQTGVTSSIRFSFSKIRKIQRLENLLKENNVEYTTYNLGDGKTEFNIKIDKSQVSKDFNWVNINDLCSNWCQEFIEELSHWDSSIRNEGRIKFDTTNTAVISTVELIALSAGYGCLISEYEDERSELFSKVYTANILLDNKLGGQSIQVEKTKYKGNIVCVTVPTGRVVVKRNRCTMVCGNSGDPVDIICGTAKGTLEQREETFKYAPERLKYTPEHKGIIELLWDVFGGTVNEQGYKVLNPKIGCIYGEAINQDNIKEIFQRLEAKGFAATNCLFGQGSYSVQYVTRDTWGMALKCIAQQRNGELVEINKNPITDDGTKKSAKGLTVVYKDKQEQYYLKDQASLEDVMSEENQLKVRFRDGEYFNQTTLTEIRERVNAVL